MHATHSTPGANPAPRSVRAELAAVVVTSSPELFSAALAREFGLQVFVCDTKEQALTAINSHVCKNVFVDLAEIKANTATNWSGFRFLRHVRGAADLSGIPVWLMTTDRAYPHTEWATQLGAAGLVPRNAASVARAIRESAGPHTTASQAVDKTRIRQLERAFIRLAPAKGADVVTLARRELANLSKPATASDYASRLAATLTTDDLRDALLRAASMEATASLAWQS